jgi:phage FluMu gp28-like protein
LPVDAWGFLTDCAYTTDEYAKAKGIEPVQPFPRDPYLEYCTRQWQAHDRLRYEKSRDMVMSWWATGVHLHAILTIPGIYVGYASKKLLDANLFIESRFKTMYHRIPARYAVPAAVHNKSDGMFVVEHANGLKSYLVGVPQGTEQARQFKFLFYWWDEMAAAEKQEQTWTAIRPALAVGGKFTAVCSAKGKANLFYQLGYEAVTSG